jgi:hypothetical protein
MSKKHSFKGVPRNQTLSLNQLNFKNLMYSSYSTSKFFYSYEYVNNLFDIRVFDNNDVNVRCGHLGHRSIRMRPWYAQHKPFDVGAQGKTS